MRLEKGLSKWPWHCFLSQEGLPSVSPLGISARVQLFLATLILPRTLISILFLEIKASSGIPFPHIQHPFFRKFSKRISTLFQGIERERERGALLPSFTPFLYLRLFDLEKGGKSCSPIIVRNTISSSLFLRGFRSLFSPPPVFASSNVPSRKCSQNDEFWFVDDDRNVYEIYFIFKGLKTSVLFLNFLKDLLI